MAKSKYSPRARRFVTRKIRALAHEGVQAPQRIAQSLSMARRRGLKVPPRPNPNPERREPANEHIRNAMAMIHLVPRFITEQNASEFTGRYAIERADLMAILARLKTALQQLEGKHVDIPLPNVRRGRIVRRRNPALMVLGNPRVVDADIATWAKLEYQRPDDPDGKDVIRVHEFPDGFEIGWLSDGSVQLSHPRHALWMEDGES